MVGRVGRLGRYGTGACPNLPQRPLPLGREPGAGCDTPYYPSRRSRSSTLSGRRTHPCFAPLTQATPGRGER